MIQLYTLKPLAWQMIGDGPAVRVQTCVGEFQVYFTNRPQWCWEHTPIGSENEGPPNGLVLVESLAAGMRAAEDHYQKLLADALQLSPVIEQTRWLLELVEQHLSRPDAVPVHFVVSARQILAMVQEWRLTADCCTPVPPLGYAEILTRAKQALPQHAEFTIDVAAERIHYSCSFTVMEDEEQHDASWRQTCEISESLAAVGLCVQDAESDNDTTWGYIVQKDTP